MLNKFRTSISLRHERMSLLKTIKVIRVPIPSPTLWPHTTTNSYLIGNEHESILVDAAYDQQVTRTELDRVIRENQLALPKLIILTHSHRDHAPGVRQLVDWNSKPAIYCHEEEKNGILAAISPLQELSYLQDLEAITIADTEILVMHTPGHTPGHLSLYIPSEEILISGDNIVAKGTTWIGPPDGDMADYMTTLKRLKSLKLKKIGPGHGDWVDSPYEHIDFVLNRRNEREKQILSLLKEHGPLGPDRLTEMIYKDTIHPSVFPVAAKTTEAHLIKLAKDGMVHKQDEDYLLK